MSSGAIRDPLADHLITPQNAALILIDYQPAQFATVRSMDPELLLKNIVSTVRTAKTFGLPIVHSTVNVASGQGKPTVPELAGLLEDTRRSTERASTPGRTSTSLLLCAPPGVAS
jgi:nicotinamidase-related amidase